MLSDKQISRWIIGATVAPLIMVSAGESWLWLLVLTLICGIAALCGGPTGRWGSILQWVAAIVALLILLPQAKQCWPTDPHAAVPLILLALATWSASKGIRAAAGVSCVLFWFVIIMYGGMLSVLISEVQWADMVPGTGMGSWTMVLLLLIPAVPLGEGRRKYGWIPGVIATVTAMVTAAVIPGDGKTPFYEAIRSVKIRLEPILGAAATTGWFLLLSILLSVSGESVAKLHEKLRIPAVVATAEMAAVSLLCGLYIPAWIGVVFVAISWVFLPFTAQIIDRRKKVKKSEKNP